MNLYPSPARRVNPRVSDHATSDGAPETAPDLRVQEGRLVKWVMSDHAHTELRDRHDCTPGKRCVREESTYAGILSHLKDGHSLSPTRAQMDAFRVGEWSPIDVHHEQHPLFAGDA